MNSDGVSGLLVTDEVTNDPVHAGARRAHAADGPPPAPAGEAARAQSVRPGFDPDARTGILLVNHGSRSAAWRGLLLDVHDEVADSLLAIPGVGAVRTGFMEYTEPSIATQLKAFDAAGIERVIVIPLLLTISDHSFDDIPAICGLVDDPELIARLGSEGIEVYSPSARLEVAPLLDFSGLVQRNTVRRVSEMMGDPADLADASHGLVLVGYGSAEFNDDWDRFFISIREHVERELGIAASAHAWCGHLVNYSRQPTTSAIESMLERTERVIVVPILVAYDPMFQDKIIGRAVERSVAPERILYRPDSILPEPEVGSWVVDIARQLAATTVDAAT
ncbi:MAG: cobalamin biosynthesis protein CbiX [Chloroflexi bacterium]|nr:cobalamin biosynthesis protein CbiX [Chloroflexota bacterium]